MVKLVFGAALLVALVTVSLPLHAQIEHRTVTPEEGKNAILRVCNAGKVDIDVLVAKANPVVTTHILPNTCAPAYSDTAGVPAYVGFALVDSQGQWGAARRMDFLPDLGLGDATMNDLLPSLLPGRRLGRLPSTRSKVIDSVAKNVSVRRGNQDVPAQLQLSFRPMTPGCAKAYQSSYSEEANLPLNATASQRAQASNNDARNATPSRIDCDVFVYTLNAAAYPESREISFLKGCTDCFSYEMPMSPEQRKKREELPQRQEWSDLLPFLYKSANRPVALPKNIVIRGTISRVDTALPGASAPWVNVYFSESPDRMFDVCSSSPDIFQDLFGADFRASMIGKTVEVEGDVQRYYCDGKTGSIRVTLARQVHPPGSARVEVAPTIALKVPPTPAAAPFQQQAYLDPGMPNYDVNASAQILQICRGLYNPIGSRLNAEQIALQNTNPAAIEAEVQKCVSSFDAAEARAHRRIAMHYCLGKNDLTAVLQGARAKAYDECMRQNDVLTELCTREMQYRGELNRVTNLADHKCPAPEPNGREILVMRNGGHDDAGKPVVIPSKGPGLPAILLAPMEPGMIERAASPVAAPPPPVPAPAKAAAPAKDATSAPVAPVASPAQQRQPQAQQQIGDQQKRAQQYTACLQQAGKDYPRGSPDLVKAVTACVQILQAK
jgi:hypothetical protein